MTARAPASVRGFPGRLIDWQKAAGRHDLPWQNTRDPYAIWISEIMLQQTQVATVIPFYARFMARFPDLAALAAAPLDEVLGFWSGLGYYSRARNLHRAARRINEAHGGSFPANFEAVLALPGIGRSTAAAICVFAFGARRPILDGNVKRVLARYFGVAGNPADKRVADALWRKAARLVPAHGVEAYTQGLMDLGSAVCVRREPRCAACPVSANCVARRRGLTDVLPSRRIPRPVPHREVVMLVLRHGADILLEKRPPSGIWGGLWSFPEAQSGDDLEAACEQRFGARVRALEALPVVEHGFTHFRLSIVPQPMQVLGLGSRTAEPGAIWIKPSDAHAAAIPAPVRRILKVL